MSPHPEPRPWTARASSIPTLPGSADQLFDRLAELLSAVGDGIPLTDSIKLTYNEQAVSIREAVAQFRSCGLLQPLGRDMISLTPIAKRWLDARDPITLIATLHAYVRFVGEALAAVESGNTGHDELLRIASVDYGTGWTSLDQIRRRTSWLRAGGFVELWNTRLVMTEAGRSLLQDLCLADPMMIFGLPESKPEPEFFSATPAIQELLDGEVPPRRMAIGFIPAGGDNLLAALSRLVEIFTPRIQRSAFLEVCRSEFEVSDTSSRMVLDTVRGIGLVEQTGVDEFAPTRAAMEWKESGYATHLAMIVHAHVACFLELVVMLHDEAGRPRRAPTDLTNVGFRGTRGEIQTRLRLLSACGMLAKVSQGRYVTTALGAQLASRLDVKVGSPVANLQTHETELTPMQDTAIDTLCTELIDAGRESGDSKRLELAIEKVLVAVGIDAEHIGGGDGTDVLATIWLEPGSTLRICIDAKTSRNGIVAEMNFSRLKEHQRLHSAAHVAVVGPGFGPADSRYAKENGVVLVTTAQLAEYVRRQWNQPLPHATFSAIFIAGCEEEAESRWHAMDQERSLIYHVHETLWSYAMDPKRVSRTRGFLTASQLDLLLVERDVTAGEAKIINVLAFLSSPLVNAVRSEDDGRFVAVISPTMLRRHLSTLGRI
ncbi:hypothetical protein AB0H43_12505 [Hamadaea sp. NPDC050747]|uniref:hypothetical protein n=1 Tax=Hamadaea sp. NPDC050747 TaxID=3155789 RepID=UPI0033C42CD6